MANHPEISLLNTYRLDLHPAGGVRIGMAARDAHILSVATGLRVDVIHNDRRYRVKLEVTEDGPAKDTA